MERFITEQVIEELIALKKRKKKLKKLLKQPKDQHYKIIKKELLITKIEFKVYKRFLNMIEAKKESENEKK